MSDPDLVLLSGGGGQSQCRSDLSDHVVPSVLAKDVCTRLPSREQCVLDTWVHGEASLQPAFITFAVIDPWDFAKPAAGKMVPATGWHYHAAEPRDFSGTWGQRLLDPLRMSHLALLGLPLLPGACG